MGASYVPAAALVDVAVTAHQEVVADGVPAVLLHVQVLDVANVFHALVLGQADVRSGVADDHVGWG